MQTTNDVSPVHEHTNQYLIRLLKKKDQELIALKNQLAEPVCREVIVNKVVEPEEYVLLKQQNAELQEQIKSYISIVDFASLPTLEIIVKRIHGYLQPEITELLRMANMLSGTKEGQKKLKELRDYLRSLDKALSRFITESYGNLDE